MSKNVKGDKNLGHGFSVKATQESITPEDFVFGDGSLESRFKGATVIRPDGKWDDYLPTKEIQLFPWGDTYHCTVYGSENVVQTLMKAKYGVTEEYTERFLGVLAGIRNGSGGSPHTVLEKWRSNGNLPYEVLPFEGVKSWAEFNSPNPMTQELINTAKIWLKMWSIGHDWIWDFHPEVLVEALKYSPLGVGVYAWYEKDGVYINPGTQDNHWVMLYSYVWGKYWLIYDHYDNVIKKLDWNYPFKFAKRITLEKLINDIPQSEEAEENNMKVFIDVRKRKNSVDYVYRDKTTGEWARFGNEAAFYSLVGRFSDVTEEIDVPKEKLGSPVYRASSIIGLLTSLLTNLKGRK